VTAAAEGAVDDGLSWLRIEAGEDFVEQDRNVAS
jgi:hypothetical protein